MNSELLLLRRYFLYESSLKWKSQLELGCLLDIHYYLTLRKRVPQPLTPCSVGVGRNLLVLLGHRHTALQGRLLFEHQPADRRANGGPGKESRGVVIIISLSLEAWEETSHSGTKHHRHEFYMVLNDSNSYIKLARAVVLKRI